MTYSLRTGRLIHNFRSTVSRQSASVVCCFVAFDRQTKLKKKSRRQFSFCFRKGMTKDLNGTWIIGGGLAGLATAAALLKITGLHCVVVLEKTHKDEHSKETAGAAAQIGPNGFRALKAIGGQSLVQRIIDKGSVLTGIIITSKGQSTIHPIENHRDPEYPQVLIRWGVLRSILLNILPSEMIQTGVGADIRGYSRVDSTDRVIPVDKDGQLVGPTDASPPLILVAAGMFWLPDT